MPTLEPERSTGIGTSRCVAGASALLPSLEINPSPASSHHYLRLLLDPDILALRVLTSNP
jgi:hypothetical protein